MTMHAIERAKERYNKDYSLKDIQEIRKNIKNGKIIGEAFNTKNEKSTNKLAYTIYNHIPLKVLFDPKSYYIVSMFPFDFDEFDKLQNKYNINL